MPIGGALVKGMIGGALKERAKNIGKTKAGKLLAREGRVMTGKPQPKAAVGAPAQAVQPQQTLVPAAPDTGGGGVKSFKSDKEAALSIKTSTIQVATLLKGSYVLQKEQLKNQRKAKEKGSRDKAEKGLEKGPKGGGKVKMPKLPGKGLLDKIFGFVSTIVFGWLALKLVDWMPTLQRILPTLGRVADWFISAGIWVVDALAGIIDFGYKLVDKMEGWVKNVFGEEGAEKFKTFMTNLKDLISGFLVWKIIGQKIFAAVIKNIKFAFGIAKAIVVNAFKFVNFVTGGAAQKGLTAVTQGLTKVGSWIGKKTGITAAKNLGGKIFKHGAKRAGKRALLKMFGKQFVKRAGSIFGRVPIVGPLIVGLVSLVSGEPIGQALFKTFGAALGGFLGTIAGTAIAAAFATVTAGIGGFLVGLILPASVMIGEILGTFVGDMLYSLIFKGGLSAVGKKLKGAFTTIAKKIVGGLNFIKDFITGGFSRFYEGIPKFKVPDIPEEPPKWIPKWVPMKKRIWKAFRIGIKILIGPLSLLMGREIPNLLWLYNPFNTFPLLMKSFFPPGGPKEGAKPKTPTASKSSSAPATPSKDLDKEAERKEKEAKRKERLDAMKKKVGDVTGAVTGAASKAWNWITGGGDDKKGKVIKDALNKKNAAEKSSSKKPKGEITTRKRELNQRFDPETGILYVNNKPLSVEETNKFINLSAKEQLDQYGKTTSFETKLTTTNNQGGAKAVIESISTTASYEKTGKEVVTVPATTSSSPSDTPTTKKSIMIMNSGGQSDPYEGLYKGG